MIKHSMPQIKVIASLQTKSTYWYSFHDHVFIVNIAISSITNLWIPHKPEQAREVLFKFFRWLVFHLSKTHLCSSSLTNSHEFLYKGSFSMAKLSFYPRIFILSETFHMTDGCMKMETVLIVYLFQHTFKQNSSHCVWGHNVCGLPAGLTRQFTDTSEVLRKPSSGETVTYVFTSTLNLTSVELSL